MTIMIEDMVECAERELKMRQRVYPRWVQSAKMKQADADEQLAHMAAIAAYLKAERDEWKPWIHSPPFDVIEMPASEHDVLIACMNPQTRRPYLRFVRSGDLIGAYPDAYAYRIAPAPSAPPAPPPAQATLL